MLAMETRAKRLVRMASETASFTTVKKMLKDDVNGDWESMALRFISKVDPFVSKMNIPTARVDKDIALSIYGIAVTSELNKFNK